MNQITVTEILGTDALNASRITINSNFAICEGAINNLLNIITIGESSSIVGTSTTQFKGSSITLGQQTLDSQKLEQLLNLLNQ